MNKTDKETKALQLGGKGDNAWSYAPAPESTDHIKLKKRYDLFINGKFVKPATEKYFDTINPATEKKIAEVAEAGQEDVNNAVKAARNAYNKVWSKMPEKERGKYIFRIARMIQERAREFSVIETMDGGKPIRESRDVDVPLAANHFFYYAGWADKLEYAFPGRQAKSLGVAGQIIPWNSSRPCGTGPTNRWWSPRPARARSTRSFYFWGPRRAILPVISLKGSR